MLLLSDLEVLKRKLDEQKEDIVRSMITELDKRHVGGDRYVAETLLNRATDMQEKILEVLNKFTNGSIMQVRSTRARSDHGGVGNDGGNDGGNDHGSTNDGGNDARMMLIDTGEGGIVDGKEFLQVFENDNRNEAAGKTNNADSEMHEGVDPVLRDLKPKSIIMNWECMREGSMKLVTEITQFPRITNSSHSNHYNVLLL